jgi:hypothetical protein
MSTGPVRSLYVDLNHLGDLVGRAPLIDRLAVDGPVDLLTKPWGAIFADHPQVGAVHALKRPSARGLALWWWGERARLAPAIAAAGYGRIIHGVRERGHLLSWLRTLCPQASVLPVELDDATADEHAQAPVARTLARLGGGDSQPRLTLRPERLATARAALAPLGRRVVSVQAGSSLTHHLWRRRPNLKGLAPAQWGAFLGWLLTDGGVDALVLHGSARERDVARAVRAAVPAPVRARVHDLAVGLGVADAAAVIAASAACVSVDTGPAHIAAALAVPTLVVFGPTRASRYRPLGPGPVVCVEGAAACRPCYATPVWDRCRANICLTTLPAARLHGGWRELIRST